MRTYYWQGIDQDGKKKDGFLSAVNLETVHQDLVTEHIVPTKIIRPSRKKIARKEIMDFSCQLAAMINSGLSLLDAFNIATSNVTNNNMLSLLQAIKKDIIAGVSLSEALRKWRYFDDFFCNLIYAGEQSGTLGVMLQHVVDYQEKLNALKSKIKKAMFYPITVLLLAVVITAVLLIFVVPQFSKLFSGFGASLPPFTQFIIRASNLCVNNWYKIVGLIFSVIFVYKILLRKSPNFTLLHDKLVLKIPILGKVLHKTIVARIANSLAITFAAGITLDQALQLVKGIAANRVYSSAINAAQIKVVAGEAFSHAFKQQRIFPQRMVQMLAVGEKSGSLAKMLRQIADIYTAEVDYIVANLSNLLEPVIMVVLAVVVGGLIVGMYLPIFKLGMVV